MTRALGLDVGGTYCKVVVVEGSDVIHRGRVPIPGPAMLDFVVDLARESVDTHDASSVGVGLAGLVRHPEGEFVWGPHLEGKAVPYRKVLSDALRTDVVVDNDANFAAWAEWSIGAGERADPMILISLGTGIGMGTIIGGVIYRGASFAGEAGHIEVVPDGEACDCGRRGCWETLVSGARLDRLAGEIVLADPTGGVARVAGDTQPTGEHLAEAARLGDVLAVSAIGDAGRWLGRGLANLVLTLDPARIVIGGAAAGAGQPLLGPAATVLREAMAGAAVRSQVPVLPARFGPWAGAVGAAIAGRERDNG